MIFTGYVLSSYTLDMKYKHEIRMGKSRLGVKEQPRPLYFKFCFYFFGTWDESETNVTRFSKQ